MNYVPNGMIAVKHKEYNDKLFSLSSKNVFNVLQYKSWFKGYSAEWFSFFHLFILMQFFFYKFFYTISSSANDSIAPYGILQTELRNDLE